MPRALAAPSRMALARLLGEAGTELDEALVLLAECGVTDPSALPVGLLDRTLLLAHRAVLGRDLEVVARCTGCGELNELPLGADDVPPYEPRWAWCGPGAGVREPVAADLAGLPADAAEAGAELVRRCAVGPATHGVRDETALGVAEQSLCGQVHVACVRCAGPVSLAVDVQHLVVNAVARAVAEVDVEVHLIASRYGWDLATIEALPERRRVRLAALAGGGAP